MRPQRKETAICPICGERQEPPEPFYSERWLRPNTILHGRYLIGLLLERWGDTYIAFDLVRGERVFVRELHPRPLVRREGADVVLPSSSSEYLEYWEQGFPEFLQIGNILLRRPDGLSIPRARHIFQDSNPAYIVLDLPKHKADLETYVRENGPLEYESCVYALLPLTKDLAWLRQVGGSHRQIDPHHTWVNKAADGQRDGMALHPKDRIQSLEELGKRSEDSAEECVWLIFPRRYMVRRLNLFPGIPVKSCYSVR